MNTVTFRPTVDWSHELLNSIRWILETFAITAPCLLVVLVLVGRMTEWGRQFWRITGDYFKGRQSLRVWVMLALLLLSTIASVRLTVLLSYQINDIFTALQLSFTDVEAGESAFWTIMVVFAVLATCYVVRLLLDLYLMQRFIMRWRIWLSHRFVDDWLGDFAYFRRQFARQPIDNPDQRIQQDIDIFTTGVGGQPNNPAYRLGSHLAVRRRRGRVVGVLVRRNPVAALRAPDDRGVTLHRALFWIVIVYVLTATIIAFVIGRPLIRLSFLNELRNAGFRYALVRVRDASAAIGLYRGEDAERSRLKGRLASVMDNYRGWLNRMVLFTGWNLSMSQVINPLPYLVQAPRLFAQQISLGDVMQSTTAFAVIHESLSFFRNAYDQFAGYRAAVIRLDGLLQENSRARAFTAVETAISEDGTLEVDGVEVRTPDGEYLVNSLDLRLDPGDTLLISGPSGIGKTVLLQSLAGLWPFVSGRVRLPAERQETMFVPQLPYVPLGDLRSVVSYPHEEGAVGDREIQQALIKVALSHLVIRINDVKDWAHILSVGEQQRIAFARILLSKPRAVFLDESTSAMDEGLELMLYELIRAELPKTILVSVSHRATVEQFHGCHLALVGGGEWRLDRLTTGS